MTQELFHSEPMTRVCTAKIIYADGQGIRLDRTLFHPQGDGQPGDTGLLEPFEGSDIVIVDCMRDDDGTPLHIAQPGSAVPEAGTRVNMVLNWERRWRLMRLHSALHLLSALVGGAAVASSEVGEHEAWLEFDLTRTLPDLFDLQRELDRLIESNQAITVRMVERDELAAIANRLSARPHGAVDGRRLVEIKGLDSQLCNAVHTATTREIGLVEITRIERREHQLHRIDIRLG